MAMYCKKINFISLKYHIHNIEDIDYSSIEAGDLATGI